MCGVQGHADCCGSARAAAHVRGAGVRPRGQRGLFLAARLHAPVLRLSRVRGRLRLGLQTRPLAGGTSWHYMSVYHPYPLFTPHPNLTRRPPPASLFFFLTVCLLSLSAGGAVLRQHPAVHLHRPKAGQDHHLALAGETHRAPSLPFQPVPSSDITNGRVHHRGMLDPPTSDITTIDFVTPGG